MNFQETKKVLEFGIKSKAGQMGGAAGATAGVAAGNSLAFLTADLVVKVTGATMIPANSLGGAIVGVGSFIGFSALPVTLGILGAGSGVYLVHKIFNNDED